MGDFFTAYRQRLNRNQRDLLKLAELVKKEYPDIEVYHNDVKKKMVDGLVFFKDGLINSISFHDVPYRWSGCGYEEFHNSHTGGKKYINAIYSKRCN